MTNENFLFLFFVLFYQPVNKLFVFIYKKNSILPIQYCIYKMHKKHIFFTTKYIFIGLTPILNLTNEHLVDTQN